MALQFRYQRAKMYRKVALGLKHHMSVSHGETAGWLEYLQKNISHLFYREQTSHKESALGLSRSVCEYTIHIIKCLYHGGLHIIGNRLFSSTMHTHCTSSISQPILTVIIGRWAIYKSTILYYVSYKPWYLMQLFIIHNVCRFHFSRCCFWS